MRGWNRSGRERDDGAPTVTGRGDGTPDGHSPARRIAVPLGVALAAAGVLLAPAPAQQPAADGAGPSPRPVGSAVLACPELSVTDDSASMLAGLVAPAEGASPEGASPEGAGAAALRAIDADTDLARIAEPGEPVTLLVAGRSQPPILLAARGAWAPGAIAAIASNEREGAGAGLASAACPAPGAEWWFVGAGSQLGRGAALLVSNPAEEPARFDLAFHARSGPIEALGGTGIDLGPQSHVRLRLDALAEGQDLLAVQVRATAGRVAAALRDVAVPRGEAPRGVDYLPPAVAPTTSLVLPGIPGGEGSRELLLVNPGTQFATVSTRLVTEAGPADLPGLASIAVPAGSVINVPLEGLLAGQPASLALTSDVPITGGLRSSWGTTVRDISWLSAVPAVSPPNSLAAAAAVPAGGGLATSVTVVAAQGAVAGTLWVSVTGSAEESIFSADGPLATGELAQGDGARRGAEVSTAPSTQPTAIRVEVPAGAQRTIDVPGAQDGALGHLWWRSDPGTGPAWLSHLTRADDGPLATGYSWWPTVSAVAGTAVREDVGTLAPAAAGTGAPADPGDTSAGSGAR